jgi:hypothetical protein
MRQSPAAVLLLLVTAAGEFLWLLFPPELRADVQLQARCIESITALFIIWRQNQPLTGELAGALVFGVLSLGSSQWCSLVWLIERFEIPIGEESCTQRYGIPVVIISAVIGLITTELIARRVGKNG